jgi:hypothetical protein
MINPTKAFLVFVILTGIFGIFVGLKDRQSKDSLLFRKPFLRGCFGLASGLAVLSLFVWNIFGALMALGAIGILLLLQECAMAGIARFRSQGPQPPVLTVDKTLTEVKREETWEQIRKRGLARFVIVKTALYGFAGIVLTGLGVMFSPEQLPLYMSISIILAGAVGGATVAIRQWNWHENERSIGIKSRGKN